MGQMVEVGTALGVIRGQVEGDVAYFRGVPYALSPVGERRFAPPVPARPWRGTFDATQFAVAPSEGSTDIDPLTSSLFLNITAPYPLPADAPICIYLHGGGFISGTPNSPVTEGTALARKGFVAVTASYRVGIDGFGHVPGAPNNRGVLDILLALRTIAGLSESLQGRLNPLYLVGHSAGGTLALAVMGSPSLDVSLAGIWCSSARIRGVTPAESVDMVQRLSRTLGVTASREGLERFDRAQLSAVERRIDRPSSTLPLARRLAESASTFGPITDDVAVAGSLIGGVRRALGAGVPLFLGMTTDEATGTISLDTTLKNRSTRSMLRAAGADDDHIDSIMLRDTGDAARALGRWVTDLRYLSPFSKALDDLAESPGAAVWAYRYGVPRLRDGLAAHGEDVPALFGTSVEHSGPGVQELHDRFISFLSGSHAPWPKYTTARRSVLSVNYEASIVADGYSQERLVKSPRWV